MATGQPSNDARAQSHSRRSRSWTKVAGFAALTLVLAACSGDQSALNPQGLWADKQHDLWKIVFGIAVVVFILVQALIVYAVVKFRQKPDDDGSLPVQVHGNTKLEVTWTVIPALILAVIAVPTVQLIWEMEEEDPDAEVIEVIGHRWWWEYRYDVTVDGEDHTIVTANELVMPVDRGVALHMSAEESGSVENGVIHSYWVPALAGKKDVVPGRINILKLQADEPGEYLGQCAEYCGLSHANMRQRVIVLTEADYDAWIRNQIRDAVEPAEGSLAATGRDLVTSGACAGCHAIQGTGALGITGPNLTHLMSRGTFAGAIYDMTEENLFNWVKNAPAMKAMHPELSPSIGMPSFEASYTDEDIRAIVAYLMTLE